MHLATHPNGAVGVCCEADTSISKTLSNNQEARRTNKLGTDTVEQIMNSNNFKQYRLELINDVWPDPCTTCKVREDAGQVSKRLRENAKWLPIVSKDVLVDRMNPDGSLNEINFEFIELRLANTCNSACITCNPVSSSRWIKDAEQLSTKLTWYQNIYTGENNWTRDPAVFADIAAHSDGLKEIYINGGEPTLIPEHYVLLEQLIQRGRSQNIRLHYSINCTRLPDELVQLWTQFREVQVSCSIDEVGDRNSYIRWPTDWGTVLEVVGRLHKLQHPNIHSGITQTVSIFNNHTVSAFDAFVRTAWPGFRVWKNHLRSPTYLKSSFDSVDDQIKFAEYVRGMDQIRGTHFPTTFPELKHLYDYK